MVNVRDYYKVTDVTLIHVCANVSRPKAKVYVPEREGVSPIFSLESVSVNKSTGNAENILLLFRAFFGKG